MRKITAILLCLILCCPAFATAETPATPAPAALTASAPPAEETAPIAASAPSASPAAGDPFIPAGVWTLTGDGEWRFVTQSVTGLDDEQKGIADDLGLVVIDGELPLGITLTPEQLARLFPDMGDMFAPPLLPGQTPPPASDVPLHLFELTGTWFYGDDNRFYYRHDAKSPVMSEEEVFAAVAGQPKQTSASQKIVYLTIDDTPSVYTMDMLAVLNRLGIKATFFVVGAYARQRPDFLRAIYGQGHGIANHSYSHNATILASSFKSCLNDFRRCEEAVNEALGFTLPMPILRIPYGASTIPVSYRTQLQEHGYLWIDWNSLNGDTEDDVKSDSAALERAFSTASRYDGSIVLLVHDGKKRTIRTLPALVEHFEALGYEFRALNTNIERIPGVRMGFPKK